MPAGMRCVRQQRLQTSMSSPCRRTRVASGEVLEAADAAPTPPPPPSPTTPPIHPPPVGKGKAAILLGKAALLTDGKGIGKGKGVDVVQPVVQPVGWRSCWLPAAAAGCCRPASVSLIWV